MAQLLCYHSMTKGRKGDRKISKFAKENVLLSFFEKNEERFVNEY